MATLNEIRQRFQKAKQTLPSKIEYYIKQEEEIIVTLNREQLRVGVRSDNQLMPEYNSKTIDNKRENRKIWTGLRISLADTGAFWAGMYIDVTKDRFLIKSSDKKEMLLRLEYGRQIFGLTKKNTLYLKSVIEKPIGEAIKNILYGL